ncbi:MAG TPA: tetratricopeptide repeat protein [bacterium]|nr:tetratricopeptide repeat protein [bacterium]
MTQAAGDLMGLGERIRQQRQNRGLTQEQLANGQLTKSFISLLERGVAKPSVDTLSNLARRLGTSVDALLGSEGHLPDRAAVDLLTLSADAMRKRRMDLADKLHGAARFVGESFNLDEPLREVALQEAQLALERRDYDLASQKISEGLHRCTTAQDPWRTGRALVLKGRLQLVRRELHQAVKTFEQALATLRLAKASRDPARSEALIFLGTTLAYLGQHDLAMKRYVEAADAQATRHDPVLRGRALWGLGLAYRRLGDLDRATGCLSQARAAFEATEELADLARVLHNIGQLLFAQRRYSEALRHLGHALRLTERLDMRIVRAATLTEMARVHLAIGHRDDAKALAERAISAAKDAPDAMEGAEARTVLAAVYAKQRPERAKELMAQALTTFRLHGAHARIAQAARDLGETLLRYGAKTDAADQLVIALEAEDALRKGNGQ